MNEKQTHHVVAYWSKTAKHNYDTLLSLFKARRYSDSLFFGHLLLEKMLKALVVKKTKTQAPFTHDLIRLQQTAALDLTEEEIQLLNKVNDFNIRARYPDYKLKFYKVCTKEYTQKHLNQITSLYEKLCQKLKPKR